MHRSSGILLHITSLPSRYGIGNLGQEAYRFVDFLKKAGQRCWQILPLCPPDESDSPYHTYSVFAGNPYLIDPDGLIAAGWLPQSAADAFPHSDDAAQVDFAALRAHRHTLLRAAYDGFCERIPDDYDAFLFRSRDWLPDYALFMALKAHFDEKPWMDWPQDIRLRRPAALRRYRMELDAEIGYQNFLQYVFDLQWTKLKQYAAANGVRIIGDIPISVPLDSADVWSAPENYQLTRTRRPRVVAGCPPDGFNADGQYWGNPIYDWDAMAENGYSWWLRRIGAAGEKFDVIRIDHFRGLESYWAIPAANKTARKGKWVKGPGLSLIRAIRSAYPHLDFIAEDLGFLTEDVYKLVANSGWPGMKVLEFAFDDPDHPSTYLPHLYKTNCICYTGTHDNDTLCHWCESLTDVQQQYVRRYLRLRETDDLPSALIRAGMRSKAQLFMAQMQDYLRLDGSARMNEPGICQSKNWRWRMLPGAADDALAAQIAELTAAAKRV